jgi:hypothetical protein
MKRMRRYSWLTDATGKFEVSTSNVSSESLIGNVEQSVGHGACNARLRRSKTPSNAWLELGVDRGSLDT